MADGFPRPVIQVTTPRPFSDFSGQGRFPHGTNTRIGKGGRCVREKHIAFVHGCVTVSTQGCGHHWALQTKRLRDFDASAGTNANGNHHGGPSSNFARRIREPAERVGVSPGKGADGIAALANESQPCIRHRSFDSRPALIHKPLNSITIRAHSKKSNRSDPREALRDSELARRSGFSNAFGITWTGTSDSELR